MLTHVSRAAVEDSLRTAVATGASLAAARLLGLPEYYWAPITTAVVTQSTVSAAWTDSRQRFFGTLLGAICGAVLAKYFGANAVTFFAGVFLVGVICTVLRLERPAYRFGTITIAIVVLIQHAGSSWIVALHRFLEVSLGILVALVMARIWPERNELKSGSSPETPVRRPGGKFTTEEGDGKRF